MYSLYLNILYTKYTSTILITLHVYIYTHVCVDTFEAFLLCACMSWRLKDMSFVENGKDCMDVMNMNMSTYFYLAFIGYYTHTTVYTLCIDGAYDAV